MAKKQLLGKVGMAVMGLFAKLAKPMPAGGPMQAAQPPATSQPPLPASANPWTPPAMMQGWSPNFPITMSMPPPHMPPVTISMAPPVTMSMPPVITTVDESETEYRRTTPPIRLYLSGYAHRVHPSTNGIGQDTYNIAITPSGQRVPVYHDGPRTNPRQQPYQPNYTTKAPPSRPQEYDDYPEYSTQSPSRVARTVPPTGVPQLEITTRKPRQLKPKRPATRTPTTTTTTTEEPEQEEEEDEEVVERKMDATTTKPNPRMDVDNEVQV